MNDWTLFESAYVFFIMVIGVPAIAGILVGVWNLLKPIREILADGFNFLWN